MNNNKSLFFASFMTLIAAGVGFAIRGGILGDWGAQYGFTKSELGGITGGGLTGFGIIILLSSLIADKVGYKTLMVGAFTLHVLSAVLTLCATLVFDAAGKDATYKCLYWGMFLFAIANGLCETVINPLTAQLFPKQKTHYLNILHAGWPGGLILGALFANFFCGPNAAMTQLRWEIPMAVFLIPTVIYGVIVLKNKFPPSETTAAGLSFGAMLASLLSPVFILLLVLHAMVGYVELGTDSWITNIMENAIPGNALMLFVYTSGLMFILRFFAGPIVERINPVGLLALSGVMGCLGLYLLSGANSVGLAFLAGTVYGVGKTFLWPTMLGVVGERFPKGGALAMGAIGGIGMLSAGLLGGPGIGHKQDYFASRELQRILPDDADQYLTKDEKPFKIAEVAVGFIPATRGLDATKFGAIQDKEKKDAKSLTEAEHKVVEANLYGGRQALLYTAIVPATMAVLYTLLFLYYQATGGYKVDESLHSKD